MQIVAARWLEQRETAQDRIVAVIYRLDANHRHGGLVAGVVTGPLAKWTFGHKIIRRHFALDGDLRVGGNRQSGERPFDDIMRVPGDPAGVSVLVHPVRHVGGSDEKIDRMMAKRNSDG